MARRTHTGFTYRLTPPPSRRSKFSRLHMFGQIVSVLEYRVRKGTLQHDTGQQTAGSLRDVLPVLLPLRGERFKKTPKMMPETYRMITEIPRIHVMSSFRVCCVCLLPKLSLMDRAEWLPCLSCRASTIRANNKCHPGDGRAQHPCRRRTQRTSQEEGSGRAHGRPSS